MLAPPAIVAIAAAHAPNAAPLLVFDLDTIATRMQATKAAAARHGARALFAVKSFPHSEVLALARQHLDGFDIAGASEGTLCLSAHSTAPTPRDQTLFSITDPSAHLAPWMDAPHVTITCESVAAVQRARTIAPLATIGIRLSISALAPHDPAIGALASGDGHRRSRFGIELAELPAMLAAAGDARIGLHAHSAGVVATAPARWGALAATIMNVAASHALIPAFVNLGGSWHGVATELDASLAAARAHIPAAIELRLEPGRLFAIDAGFAIGHVTQARDLPDRALRVTTLSRLCHLRWSAITLCEHAPHPRRGRKLHLVGATCFEDDVIGEFIVEDDYLEGHPVVVAVVTGYAAAWNRSFSGVPSAEVRFVSSS